jgi:MFS family permease
LVSDLVKPEQRKQAFALSRLAVNLGMSVGPAIGGFLALYSFRFLFFADGVTSILAGLVLMFAWPGTRRTKASELEWDDPEDLGREIEAEGPALLAAPHPAADLRAFRSRRMLYFLAALIPTQLVFFQLTSTLPLFLVRYLRLPESFYGSVFTLNTLMIVALEVPLNSAMANWSHRRTLTLGALLYAIGFGSFALARGPAGVFAAVAVWTFGEMILIPGSAAYAAEIAPAGRRGEYMGLYTMSFSLGFSLGPWLGAILLESRGPQVLWGAAFVSGCVSTLLMSRIGVKPNRDLNNSALGK